MAPGHFVFGVRLVCDFALPELHDLPQKDGPLWRVETRRCLPPDLGWLAVGSETVYASVEVRSYVAPGAFRLTFDDTGSFDLYVQDRLIAWYPGANETAIAARADLLGRVMALAAHADGRLALHASAVSLDGRAIAFLGPKHAGKSTLALALVRQGARLITDDSLVVRLDAAGRPVVTPGVQRVRLWPDSARALGAATIGQATDKPTLDPLPSAALESEEVPLDACYVLSAGDGDAGSVAQRERLSPVRAALALVQFSKLGALMGGQEASIVLDRAVAVAERVPVFTAAVARDLARLGAAAAQFESWHSPSGASRTPPAAGGGAG
jgi:hypothetical protein